MYTFVQYLWLKITNNYTTKQSIIFSSTSSAHVVQWHPINAQNVQTYHFSVLLQLKDLISENMKISKKSQTCWQRWVCTFFRKTHEHIDLLFLLACWYILFIEIVFNFTLNWTVRKQHVAYTFYIIKQVLILSNKLYDNYVFKKERKLAPLNTASIAIKQRTEF